MFKRRKEKTRDKDEEKEHIVAKVWYVKKKQEIQKIQGRKNGIDIRPNEYNRDKGEEI